MLGGEVDRGGILQTRCTFSYSMENDVRNTCLMGQFGGEVEPSGREASPAPPPPLR